MENPMITTAEAYVATALCAARLRSGSMADDAVMGQLPCDGVGTAGLMGVPTAKPNHEYVIDNFLIRSGPPSSPPA